MEDSEGVWVGLATGDRTLSHYQHAPFDDAFIEQERNEVEDWLFAPNGEFELRSGLEANANLVLISKNRVPILISVAPDASVQPLEVRLSRGMELEGLIHDSNGVPISGATVSTRPSGREYEIPSFAIPQWKTGADGSFRVAGLEPREYLLIVSANDYAPMIVPNFVIPNSEVHRLEVELVKGHYVTGKVINEYGSPMPDVSVRAGWTRSHAEVQESDGVMKVGRKNLFAHYVPRTRTLADGTFRLGPFELATDGSIWADSPEFGSARLQEIYAPRNDLLLRLLSEKVHGRVLDATTGKPIEEISIMVFRPWGSAEDVRPNDGYFDLPIDPIDSEDTAILIDSQGYFPWTGRLYQGSTGNYDLGNVILERERILTGIVRNGDSGTPMEGVHILRNAEQYTDSAIRIFLSNWGQRHRAITNENGEFLMKKLPRDADRLELIVPSRGRLTVDVPAGVEEFDIDLYFNGVVEGSLVLPNGATVDGEIRLRGSTMLGSKTVDTSNGAFRWEGLPPDTYRLSGESDAGLVRSHTFTLEEGQRLSDVELQVRPGWSAEGTIAGLKGNEHVIITVRDPDKNVWNRTWSRNGPYSIHGIPQKAALVATTSTGLSLIKVFLNGNEGGASIDFNFEHESRLNGSVTSGGEPVSGMFLRITPNNRGTVIGHTRTNASGIYEVKGISDGSHVVKTQTGLSFAVEISGNTTLDIELPQNSVSGVVRSERTRTPIGGGLARISGIVVPEASDSIRITKRIGSDGTFMFEGLLAGEYDVDVVHPNAEKMSSRVQVNGSKTIEMWVQCSNTQECINGEFGPRRTVTSR